MAMHESDALGLEKKKLFAARNAARGGQYQMLLGAGASVGAVSSYGPIPLAKDLVTILKDRYPKAPISAGDPLPRAYQRSLMVSSADHVWATLSEIFGGAKHQEWFETLAGLPWSRVWTLNVDDAFENSYHGGTDTGKRSLRTISWDDPYIQTGDLEVVHLHGHILGRESRKLVFSFSEYQAMASVKPVWNQVLAGALGVDPFVVFGASILGDPDVEALLLANRPAALAPSFVVDPFIGDGNRWELEQLGYKVLRMTGEEFLHAWQESMGLDEESVRSLEETEILSIPQFVKLQTNRVAPVPHSHDFFGGDAPVWKDIIDRRPALFPWMTDVVDQLKQWLDKGANEPTLHVIYGRRMSGVSSGLLMASRAFAGMHVDVFSFDKSSRFSVPAVLRARSGKRPAVIVIDSGADFSNDIDQLLREAATSDASLYVVVTESPQNDLRLEGRLGGGYQKKITRIPARLDHKAAGALAKKLDEFARLGSLELENSNSRIRHFKGRDVFSALMEVEHAIGFRKRLEGEVHALDKPWKRDLLLLLSIAAQGARQVGIVEAAIAVGQPSDRMSREVLQDKHLSAVVEEVAPQLVARQREYAIKAIVNEIGPDRAIARVREMVENLAPLATRHSLQQRNRPVQLVGYLMTAKQLQKNFPNVDLDIEFYDLMRPLFGDWNGRFWEQRAIYAKVRGNWATAESFAARAVGLYDDAFTRTTYGTILINKAASFASLESPTWHEFYTRGRAEFAIAMERESGNRITVFAYLTAGLDLAKFVVPWQGKVQDGSPVGSVVELKEDWERTYSGLRISLVGEENFESARRAEQLSSQWQAIWA
ncbi:hypothetical protein GA0115253_1027932 [Streptomyces sp. Termitarium-T10T-6]|nr:SIR2 family protein [Streptomyces sp. Termitarium-T10T-6]SCE04644.1 hypothetical protein GA0115253_1027932 [Streptomyces sp. Termitarium-T10T-6]